MHVENNVTIFNKSRNRGPGRSRLSIHNAVPNHTVILAIFIIE